MLNTVTLGALVQYAKVMAIDDHYQKPEPAPTTLHFARHLVPTQITALERKVDAAPCPAISAVR